MGATARLSLKRCAQWDRPPCRFGPTEQAQRTGDTRIEPDLLRQAPQT
jgi:hypothetical protein